MKFSNLLRMIRSLDTETGDYVIIIPQPEGRG